MVLKQGLDQEDQDEVGQSVKQVVQMVLTQGLDQEDQDEASGLSCSLGFLSKRPFLLK